MAIALDANRNISQLELGGTLQPKYCGREREGES